MALSAGDRLAHYVVESPLGEGGMGAVYRARDTKLERAVAIKVLPEEFSRDAERMGRFEREAKLLAALNNSNVATLHGLEVSDGRQLLIMELVEGETLTERIARGPIPVDEAVALFVQIAEGLEAAHAKGILHRDLKPGNIKIAPDGKVKILDFGLAKAFVDDDGRPAEASDSPTLTKGTALGAIMGTAAYMSPEQARGHALDKRTDVWAFGCCLFEALTGTRAFGGATVSDTIAAVLKSEPAWDHLPRSTPGIVRTVLLRCVDKDVHRRLHDVADARVLLVDSESRELRAPEPHRVINLRWALPAVAIASAIVSAISVTYLSPDLEPRATTRTRIHTPSFSPTFPRTVGALALSWDGQSVAYVGDDGQEAHALFSRRLDEWSVERIAGTDGAVSPTFSPDSSSIAFFASGELRKVPVSGGRPVSLCDASVARGVSWGEDGWIYFQQYAKGILRVREEGGEPEVVISPDPTKGEKTIRHPFPIPGAGKLLFTTGYPTMASYDEATIEGLDLETGERKVIVEGGSDARYVAPGYLVFLRNGELLSAPFDVDQLELRGPPTTAVDGVMTSRAFGGGEFGIARNGTLVYAPGGPETYNRKILWATRGGDVEAFDSEGRSLGIALFSPDGRRIAFHENTGNDTVWVYEIGRGAWIRITPEWDNVLSAWSPDGRRVLYGVIQADARFIAMKDADGIGREEKLVDTGSFDALLTSDGTELVFSQNDTLFSLSMAERSEPKVVHASDSPIVWPDLSPDDRWLAYASADSGRREIYVSPFPSMESRFPLSTAGGRGPKWSADGRELFFYSERGLFSVAIQTEPEFEASSPVLEVELPAIRDFDVDPSGERFIVIQENIDARPTELRVVLNWTSELERLVPGAN